MLYATLLLCLFDKIWTANSSPPTGSGSWGFSCSEAGIANRTKRTDRRKEKFLGVLRETCNVSEAARAAGIGRRTAYDWRDDDEKFKAEWDEAEAEAVDSLEREAWRRGVEGVDKPVTFQGKITDSYKEYSDRMLELLLKAHRPDKFKDRVATELSGAVEITKIERQIVDPQLY